MKNKDNQVRKIAKKVVRRYKLVPPVNFNQILDTGYCILKEEEMVEFLDGYTDFSENPPIININKGVLYEKRKRFTIAHELGHIFIPWHNDITACQMDNYISNNMLDIQEREANIFASELLMPSDWMKEKLNLYSNSSLKELIEHLSSEANTSIMACIYALEEAYGSGNIIVVTKDGFEYGRRFTVKNTCTTYYKGLSFDDACKKFSLYKESFKMSYYNIDYYKFNRCPNSEEVRQAYMLKYNIEDMLNNISNNNIYSILHCLDNIVSYIPDKYCILVYEENDIICRLVSQDCSIKFNYDATKEQIIKEINIRFKKYGEIFIKDDIGLLWIKEEVSQESDMWKNCLESSTKVLRRILFDIYDDDSKLHKINGVIGITYGRNKDNSREELYNKIKISLENKKDLEEFVGHEEFEKFISLRLNEIFRRSVKKI